MMKHFVLISISLMFFSLSGLAQDRKIESVYTDLNVKACKELKPDPNDGILYRGQCRGVGGYQLIFLESEHHQSLDLVPPKGDEFELNFGFLSAAPSYLGNKAEWRVRREGGRVRPFALIFRVNVSENPEKSQPVKSFLVVAKITAKTACVTDLVQPTVKNQNAKARQLADSSTEKSCQAEAQPQNEPNPN